MSNIVFYLLVIAFPLVVGALLLVQYFFRPWIRRRRASIEELEHSEVTTTSTPLQRPLSVFKDRAKRSVNSRFSIYRRIAWILVLVLIFLGVSLPFLDQLPQALISILVGSAAVIIGIAARPFIENFLSGIAITSSKMLSIGDTILINDNYGTIEDISSTHTVIKLWDWRRFVIPNGTMINHEFINYSLYDEWQFAYVEFFVSYEADLEQVKALAIAAAQKSRHLHGGEKPFFWVMDMGKESIQCWIAAWADSPLSAWELKTDIRTELVLQFRKAGIRAHLKEHAVKMGEG